MRNWLFLGCFLSIGVDRFEKNWKGNVVKLKLIKFAGLLVLWVLHPILFDEKTEL